MDKIIIANCNEIMNPIQDELVNYYKATKIYTQDDLRDAINENTEYIFFLHWSWIIPASIFERHNCIVFHMTDLPYGRGGSPLQNLIIRGHKHTKLSAIKVDRGIDTGDIYLKKDLPLNGTATEIFERAGLLMKDMIKEIVNNKPVPSPQQGEPTVFARRTPKQSLISEEITDLEKLYDFIRMLDADNYPRAFLETKRFRFEFSKAETNFQNHITANVTITSK